MQTVECKLIQSGFAHRFVFVQSAVPANFEYRF